jgi:hypothetical protein
MVRRWGSGLVAGLGAGLVVGVMLHVMTLQAPDGRPVTWMRMIAALVGAERLGAGWALHLGLSGLWGAVFGGLVGGRWSSGTTVALGWLYGLFWWALGHMTVLPLRLGLEPFAWVRSLEAVPLALGSLVGHVLWGALLGGGVAWLAPGKALTPAR